MYNPNSLDVNQYTRERAMLETPLGQNLYSVFARAPIIGRLRDFVAQEIEQLASLANRSCAYKQNSTGSSRVSTISRDLTEPERRVNLI